MARPGRRAPEARLKLAPWMRAWARGEELTGDERPEPYFASRALLRAALEHVHGVPFAEYLRRYPAKIQPGSVIVHGAIVARLSDADVVVLEEGGNPWG